MNNNERSLIVPETHAGLRVDIALQQLLPEFSRSKLQEWIKQDFVLVNQLPVTVKHKVYAGDEIKVTIQSNLENNAFLPEAIPLNIIFEDNTLLVINKPPGMVVHPAVGNWSGTLLNALLYYIPENAAIPRCGIVHRLDKDTSGLLVVAKTLSAQTHLVHQLQARSVKREYRAIVWGQLWKNGTVNQPIARHPSIRTRMAVHLSGKPAITHYEILERFGVHTYLRCNLETGRTHQIRVHMQYLKAPIVGDPVYGLKSIMPIKAMSDRLRKNILDFKRQALHAIRLGLIHPTLNKFMEWSIDLPEDMKLLLEVIRLEQLDDEVTTDILEIEDYINEVSDDIDDEIIDDDE
ncbi:MAG: 23S rRNA pseudouridine(1911/1915/1917) synthase RluD [Candidatus Methylopumilus sp.]|nr:23S rRNA pseudouridine(1911/1915/1917) synthase RluD [Candidatus Methylopumilus sp.]